MLILSIQNPSKYTEVHLSGLMAVRQMMPWVSRNCAECIDLNTTAFEH